MTYKEEIIEIIEGFGDLSCTEICKLLIFLRGLKGNKAKYLSGSVSSILNKLVKDDVLSYSEKKTKRGGYIYKLVVAVDK